MLFLYHDGKSRDSPARTPSSSVYRLYSLAWQSNSPVRAKVTVLSVHVFPGKMKIISTLKFIALRVIEG